MSPDDTKAAVQVVDRLQRREPAATRDEIAALVQTRFDQYAESRIRDFVPILVEREVRRELRSRHYGQV